MTNAEAAKHFASLPPDEDAKILLVNGDTACAEELHLDPPGENLDQADNASEVDDALVTSFMKW